MTEPTADICDCFPALRETTLARERRYLTDPSRPAPEGPQLTVEVRVVSTGDLNDRAESLKSGRTWTISEPRHVGGLADAPTPLEYLLSGVLGCFAAVYSLLRRETRGRLQHLRGARDCAPRRAWAHDRGRTVVGVPIGAARGASR